MGVKVMFLEAEINFVFETLNNVLADANPNDNSVTKVQIESIKEMISNAIDKNCKSSHVNDSSVHNFRSILRKEAKEDSL